ncbi:MAG: hypothetical protein AB1810_08275 [Pseudomonadota bacterium]
MVIQFERFLLFLMFLAATTVVTPMALASDSERHQTADGMDIYLGVIPSVFITEHPDMHGKSKKQHRYHVLVALFDSITGERITNAKVRARVSLLGLVGPEKTLEAMNNHNVMSYGNYFMMTDPGQYRIEFRIKRTAEQKEETLVRFLYRRPGD